MISFLIPFDTEEPHRLRSFSFVRNELELEWPGAEIVTGDTGGLFNRTTAINNAFRTSTGDTVVVLDADTYVPAQQINYAVAVAQGQRAVLPYTVYCSLSEKGTDQFLKNQVVLQSAGYDYVFPSDDHPEPAVSGCIVMSRDVYQEVGGFDERFFGWGEEDRAFVLALSTLVEPVIRISGPLYHLWHPWKEENCFGQPNFPNNRALCNRYREAEGDRHTMQRLVEEHCSLVR